jgi:hypothetical protein
MPGSLLRSSLSATNPDEAPPNRRQSLPGWGLGLQHLAATGWSANHSIEALPSRQPPRRLFLHPPRKAFS